MDVKRLGSLALAMTCALLLVHCSPSNPNTAGFAETSSTCAGFAHPQKFVVHWKSGATSLIHSENKDAFLEGFFSDHREEIQWAEHDYTITIPEAPLEIFRDFSAFPHATWAPERIEADKLWQRHHFGEGVLVAVVDTGVDLNHPKLQGSIYTNWQEVPADGVDNDRNGYVDDRHGYDFVEGRAQMVDDQGHGTSVAGIIAASHGSGLAKGVAPQAQILPLRTISSEGFGSAAKAAEAIRYAVSQGAQIINASWGGANCSATLYGAIEELAAHDVLFVAAAGNNSASLDRYGVYPAGFKFAHQLTVGSSGTSDLMSGFSNHSPTRVHLLAPGDFVWSTRAGGGEEPQTGTSMSAPMVAGAAALLKSAFPQASMASIRQALLEGVDAPPIIKGHATSYPVQSGGRLNVWKSFQILEAAN